MPDEDIIQKYKERLARELDPNHTLSTEQVKKITTEEYLKFKKAFLPAHLSLYEKACKISSKLLKIKLNPKTEAEIREAIEICHLDVDPSGTVVLSYIAPFILMLFGLLFTALLKSTFFAFFFFVLGALLYYLLKKMPFLLSNRWRLKASNQMINCIFYVVTYMRHTSNLENALQFASDHLTPPLSLDLKKVLWDTETNRFSSVKESLDHYLETWRKWNMEFVEAFHLIEASLYEPTEERRISLIEKALNVILTETYEKMLHYTHNLKSPITMLHMLGIILPILGLVILPMVTSFMTGGSADKPGIEPGMLALFIASIYNVFLPIVVYIMGRVILSSRPSGYGDVDITKEFPQYKKYKYFIIKLGNFEIKIQPILISAIILVVFLAIGFYPLFARIGAPPDALTNEKSLGMGIKILDYRQSDEFNKIIGPYGIGATLMSIFIPLGLGLAIAVYYKIKSNNVIKIRKETKELEKEFASGLFQLGNRIGDGIPTEIAFEKVADVLTGTKSGEFFKIAARNIRNLGMSVKEALFNKKLGAIHFFPSNTIISSMKVLVESAKKGPMVASRTMLTVAEYIKEIHRVNERLNDLMADIVSSMKQQINFMAPVIAGVVVGIASMIVTILSVLEQRFKSMADPSQASTASILGMFGDGVPSYYLQIIVGVYVVQIIYILTIMINSIQNGDDKLSEEYLLGQNVLKGTLLYSFLAFTLILLFHMLVVTVLPAQ